MSSDNPHFSYPECLQRPDLAGLVRTRTPETEAAYRKRYRWLHRRVTGNQAGEINYASSLEVAKWLAGRVSQLSHSTYRQYRASVLQALRDLCRATTISAEAAEQIAELLVVERQGQASPYAPPRPFRTSAGRTKGLAKKTAEALVREASQSRNSAGANLVDCLELGPKLGLRLLEWLRARLEGAVLTVPCGKYSSTNKRGLAPERQQTLTWSDDELTRLALFLDRLRSQAAEKDGREDLVIRRLGRLLRQIRGAAGAPRVTLRSLRHQFVANLRAAGYSREEQAAALGHASADTAGQHYGKRNRGWPGFERSIEVPPELVALVRAGAKTTAKIKKRDPLSRSEARSTPPSPQM